MRIPFLVLVRFTPQARNVLLAFARCTPSKTTVSARRALAVSKRRARERLYAVFVVPLSCSLNASSENEPLLWERERERERRLCFFPLCLKKKTLRPRMLRKTRPRS